MPHVVVLIAGWVAGTLGTALSLSFGTAVAIYSTTVFILHTLIVMAATAALQMLSKKPKNSQGSINQGSELTLKLDPTLPRQILVGKTATAGSVVWAHTHTPAGSKVPNEVLSRVIDLSDMPITSLESVRFGTATLTWSGALTSGSRVSCSSHFLSKASASRLWLTFYDGTQTTADSTLLASASGLWTANHIGRGIAYVVVEYWYDPDAFVQGEPELVYVVKGAKCYDDRYDGSKPSRTGAQRLTDPTTWAWTENAAVITAQIMRGFFHPFNTSVLMFGVGAEDRDLSDSMLLSAYNTCDQSVTRADSSTETRYRAAYNLTTSEAVSTVLQDLQAAMDGRIIDRGGAITILPGGTRTAILPLSENDIVWTEQKSWQPRSSLEELTNYITGTFVDGEGGTFQEKAFPTLSNLTWEANDGGQRFTTQVSFRAVTSWGQVQRITKRMHNSSRQQGTIAFVAPIWAMEMEQGDWFTLSCARWGFTTKYFEVQLIHLTQDLKCAIIAREVSTTDDVWVPVSDEKPRNDTFWNPVRPALTVPSFTLTPYEFVQGTVKLPAILFYQNNINLAQEAIFIELQISLTADLPSGASNSALISASPGTSVLAGHFLPNASYSVRARSVSGSEYSDWSSWVAVTTTVNFIATFVAGLGALASLDVVTWATQVTGTGKPEDYATKSRVFRQYATPTGANTNDVWVLLDSGGTIPQSLWAYNGTTWIKGADLTGLNVALSIYGQGPLATSTLTEAQVRNDLWKLPAKNLWTKGVYVVIGSGVFVDPLVLGDSKYGFTIPATHSNGSGLKSTQSGWGLAATGAVYSFSFAAKVSAGTGVVRTTIQMPAGGAITGIADGAFSIDTTLRRFSWNGLKSDDTNFSTAILSVFCNATDSTGGIVSITDMQIEYSDSASTGWRPSPDDIDVLRYAGYVGALAADVTGANTALGIVGQSPLATGNPQVTNGGNRVRFTEFEKGTVGWTSFANSAAIALTTTVTGVQSGLAYIDFGATATAAGQFVSIYTAPDYFRVSPGDQLALRVLGGATNGGITAICAFFNSSGTYISNGSSEVAMSANSAFGTVGQTMTVAPAGAAYGYMEIYITSVAAGVMHAKIAQPYVIGVPVNQTAFPPYSRGETNTSGADVTLTNVAASITSQGSLATLSAVDMATSQVANRTAGNLTYTGGATVQSLQPAQVGADVTLSNVAASITGQQAWATVKVSYQSSTPSSPTTGDIWVDSTAVPYTTKRWDGSGWVVIGRGTTNTNQLTDGASLGSTASWPSVTGTGKPADNADVTGTHVALSVLNQQAWATARVSYQSSTPTSPTSGEIWIDTTSAPFKTKRWDGSAWVSVGIATTNTSQLTDGASLGQTASWPSVTGTGRPTDNADRTSLNVAASVAGQGSLATASPAAGAGISYTLSGGVFTITNTATSGGGALTVSISGTPSKTIGLTANPTLVTTNTVTSSVSGGSGTYTYLWIVAGSTTLSPASPTSATTSSTAVEVKLHYGETEGGTLFLIVTDSGGKIGTASVGFTFTDTAH